MNKNITASFVIIALVALAASAGTLAYFSDVELIGGNTVTAGTMDLVLVDGGSPSFTEWYITPNMKPTDWKSGSLQIYNVGTVVADNMVITFMVSETEDSGPLSDTKPTSAVGMSKLLKVTSMSYADVITTTPPTTPSAVSMVDPNGNPEISGISDVNGNGYIDLDDLNGISLTVSAPAPVASTDNANDHKELSMTITFVDDEGYPANSEKNNDYQGDTTELLVQFDLTQ